jgi:hypothetical protein
MPMDSKKDAHIEMNNSHLERTIGRGGEGVHKSKVFV